MTAERKFTVGQRVRHKKTGEVRTVLELRNRKNITTHSPDYAYSVLVHASETGAERGMCGWYVSDIEIVAPATYPHGQDPANCPECTPHDASEPEYAALDPLSDLGQAYWTGYGEGIVAGRWDMEHERDEARAEVERLRAALEPFAAVGAVYEYDPDYTATDGKTAWYGVGHIVDGKPNRTNITVDDLRRAARLAAAGEGETE